MLNGRVIHPALSFLSIFPLTLPNNRKIVDAAWTSELVLLVLVLDELLRDDRLDAEDEDRLEIDELLDDVLPD
jgi:hypothetical protein